MQKNIKKVIFFRLELFFSLKKREKIANLHPETKHGF